MKVPSLVAFAAALAASATAQQFEKPFRVQAGGKPIDVDVGHAAPYVVDFDGDGIRDLLVGQFGQGRCRIYKNTGTDKAPQFGEHVVRHRTELGARGRGHAGGCSCARGRGQTRLWRWMGRRCAGSHRQARERAQGGEVRPEAGGGSPARHL